MGCGSVAMVTSLLLRRLLPSSVATFKAPTLQYSIGLEFNLVIKLVVVVRLKVNRIILFYPIRMFFTSLFCV